MPTDEKHQYILQYIADLHNAHEYYTYGLVQHNTRHFSVCIILRIRFLLMFYLSSSFLLTVQLCFCINLNVMAMIKKKKKVLQPARITLSVCVSVNDCMHEFVWLMCLCMWGRTLPKVALGGKCLWQLQFWGLKHAHTSPSIKSQGH